MKILSNILNMALGLLPSQAFEKPAGKKMKDK